MAGTGEFSRVGNTRALNVNLGSAIAGGALCPGGDLIGVISTAIAALATAQTSLAVSAGITKAIPDDAVVVAVSATGVVDTMEAFTVNGAAASAAVAVTIDSCTVNKARAVGDLLFLYAFKPFLALVTSTIAPTDNGLGSEYVATGYARQAVTWHAPTAADPPVADSNGTTTYGPLTGANGASTISYGSLMDAPSGGTADNQYAWWTWASTRTPNSGDSLNIADSALTMQSYH